MSEFIGLRDATLEDADLLFFWRNDGLTRRMSISQDEISWHEHISWLTQVLSSEKSHLFIAMLNGTPVGVLRLERLGESFDLSITVSPSARGKGIGSKILKNAKDWATANTDVKYIHASIKETNLASLKLFLRCGYLELTKGEVTRVRLTILRS